MRLIETTDLFFRKYEELPQHNNKTIPKQKDPESELQFTKKVE